MISSRWSMDSGLSARARASSSRTPCPAPPDQLADPLPRRAYSSADSRSEADKQGEQPQKTSPACRSAVPGSAVVGPPTTPRVVSRQPSERSSMAPSTFRLAVSRRNAVISASFALRQFEVNGISSP